MFAWLGVRGGGREGAGMPFALCVPRRTKPGGEEIASRGGELGGDVMEGEVGEKGSDTREGIEADSGVEGEEGELFEVAGVEAMEIGRAHV